MFGNFQKYELEIPLASFSLALVHFGTDPDVTKSPHVSLSKPDSLIVADIEGPLFAVFLVGLDQAKLHLGFDTLWV